MTHTALIVGPKPYINGFWLIYIRYLILHWRKYWRVYCDKLQTRLLLGLKNNLTNLYIIMFICMLYMFKYVCESQIHQANHIYFISITHICFNITQNHPLAIHLSSQPNSQIIYILLSIEQTHQCYRFHIFQSKIYYPNLAVLSLKWLKK